MHKAKREMIKQIDKFRISIKTKGFFELDRQFLSYVRKTCCRRIFFDYHFFFAFSVDWRMLHIHNCLYSI